MSTPEDRLLAEALRGYFIENCPFLPVKGGAFLLDGQLPEAKSMCLQMNGGQTLYQFIDDTRIMLQPFTLRYRDKATGNNAAKSAMMGVLDGIGAWMDEVMGKGPPDLGDWLTVNRFELVQTASIWERSEKFITYHAGYALGYETTT